MIGILINLAKTQGSENYDQNVLINIISNRLLEVNVGERTKEVFYKLGNLKLPFILWYGTGESGEEFNYTDIICEHIDESPQLSEELQPIINKMIEMRTTKVKELGQVFDNHKGYKLVKIRSCPST